MSDTETFDAAINHLTNRLNSRGEGSEREELRQAIQVLEDWPKWKPLIEAAQRKINIQVMDEGLWFVAITASEEYLQNALRELHFVIEKAIADYKGKED